MSAASPARAPAWCDLGLNDTYCSVVGNQSYLEKYFGLDGEGVARRVRQELGRA